MSAKCQHKSTFEADATVLTQTCSADLCELRLGDEDPAVDVGCEVPDAADGAVVTSEGFVQFNPVPPNQEKNPGLNVIIKLFNLLHRYQADGK